MLILTFADFPQAILRLDSPLRDFRKPFSVWILPCGVSASRSPFGFPFAEFPQAISSSDSSLRSFRKPFPALIPRCGVSASTNHLRLGFSAVVKLHLFCGIPSVSARKIHIPACISHNFHKFASGLVERLSGTY